jgi:hypothetical protein
MANAFFYSNIAVATTLSGSINNAVTSAVVGSTTGWPSSFPYITAFDYGGASEELVRVTANASNTLTFSRGYGGTSAVSHSAGAVVRHIFNAQDATDFRTHEAATLGVHGVAGSLVGTTDIQTLSNKTLTSPAINNGAFASGGSFAGTYTGTPTFSGALTLSGSPVITTPSVTGGTFAGSPTLTTPTIASFVNATHNHSNAAGGGQALTNPIIGTSGAASTPLIARGFAAQSVNLAEIQDSGSVARVSVGSTGALTVAPSASVVVETLNAAAGQATDLQRLQVNSVTKTAIDQNGFYTTYGANAWSTWTPAVTNGGTVVWSRQDGWYQRIGKMIFFEIYLASSSAGSGSTTVTISLPTVPFREGEGANTTRQTFFGHASGMSGSGNAFQSGPLAAVCTAGGSGAVIDQIQDAVATNLWGQNFGSACAVTIQGYYREQ